MDYKKGSGGILVGLRPMLSPFSILSPLSSLTFSHGHSTVREEVPETFQPFEEVKGGGDKHSFLIYVLNNRNGG